MTKGRHSREFFEGMGEPFIGQDRAFDLARVKANPDAEEIKADSDAWRRECAKAGLDTREGCMANKAR